MKWYLQWGSVAVTLLVCVSCTKSSSDQVVKTAYYHAYGPQVQEEEWKAEGSNGEVVEYLKNGVEVRREYQGGVLHGMSTWSFPHSKIVERTEEYTQGRLTLSAKNYETGTSKYQEEWLPDGLRVIRAWYDEGCPRYIEEHSNNRLSEAQYFTIDGELEAAIIAGTGIKIERTRSGDIVSREQYVSTELVLKESFYPNGLLRESVALVNGKRHGQCRNFLENGEPLSIEQWKQGVLDGLQVFFESGQPIRQVPYVLGKKEGTELHFRPGSEDVVEEISWHADERHGPSKTYLAEQSLTEWYWKGALVSEDQFHARDGRGMPA
ncbi:MAG: hypothetical protein M1305_06275 [Candidatus Marsarchaeota archaeon]|nr:hypothetical protein [Candidatus Marsarchaeota archaeon]